MATVQFGDRERISGDKLDGVYQSTITMPAFSEQGTWKIDYLFLADNARNTGSVQGATLAAAGYPTTFEIIRTG
jgi:hypothetical protein